MDLKTLSVPAPYRGLVDGIDPASPYFPDDAASELLNLRAMRRSWLPRLGLYHWKTLGGSGSVWFLGTHHSSALRVRLAARGASGSVQLHDFVEGVDSSFQSVSGGGSLNGDFIQSAQVAGYTYLADRSGGLKRYSSTGLSGGGTLSAVAQPTTPSVAPQAEPAWAGILEPFGALGASAPFGFTESDNANFSLAGSGQDNPLPDPLDVKSVVLTMTGASSDNDTIRKNSSTDIETPTFTFAFWARQSDADSHVAVQWGISRAAQFGRPINPSQSNRWLPIFLKTNLPALRYFRFKNVKAPSSSQTLRLSPIVMPGRLDGKYKWAYTYFDASTGAESEPSPELGATSTNPSQGTTLDLSEQGVSGNEQTADGAFTKCALLYGTPGGNVNTSGWKIRWYRNGGVPEFTVDPDGTPVWVLVGEVNDRETYFASSPLAAATSFTVNDATGLAVGDWLVLEPGVTDKAEFVKISGIAGNVISHASTPLLYGHSSGSGNKVRMAFLDNTPEQSLALAQRIDRERDDPPTGIRWLAKAPDGRLWLQYGTNSFAVSNQATTARTLDHEVFPAGVDPLTRRHPTQGFRGKVAADDPGDTIQWMGFYQGVPTFLTSRAIYQGTALSQSQWSSTAIVQRWREGCLNGRTVAEVNGALYWVAPGPQVVRWDGSGAPQPVSFERVSETLKAAPSAYWSLWHAQSHVKEQGPYYCLWTVPSGGTTPTDGLQYNAVSDAWEPVAYFDGSSKLPVTVGHVLRGAGDTEQYYLSAGVAGKVYEADRAGQLTDDGTPVVIRARSKRLPLGGVVGKVEWTYLRAPAATDSVDLSVKTGGSDYGDVTNAHSSLSFAGSGDKELRKRGAQTQKGRWVEFYLSGNLSNRLALRDLEARWSVQRDGRIKD